MAHDDLAEQLPLTRAILVWLLLMAVESLHGTLRVLLLVPAIGDLPARQVSVFTGAALIFLVTLATIRWMRIAGTRRLLCVGLLWVLLTVAFEIALGRLVMGVEWSRIAEDYDLRRGGLMPLGLLAMLVTPLLAARIRMVRV